MPQGSRWCGRSCGFIITHCALRKRIGNGGNDLRDDYAGIEDHHVSNACETPREVKTTSGRG